MSYESAVKKILRDHEGILLSRNNRSFFNANESLVIIIESHQSVALPPKLTFSHPETLAELLNAHTKNAWCKADIVARLKHRYFDHPLQLKIRLDEPLDDVLRVYTLIFNRPTDHNDRIFLPIYHRLLEMNGYPMARIAKNLAVAEQLI